MKHRAYDVLLRKRIIDTVFATLPERTREDREDSVRRSLIGHDGYDPGIKVSERPENRTAHPSDAVLASLTPRERARVIRHCEIGGAS